MAYVDFISVLHKRTTRDYVGRVNEWPKADAARRARQWDVDYWDGDRKFGYGGYRYDGRWLPVAENLAKHYDLRPGQRVLDVGCGKAFLLYELTRALPGLEVCGIDISPYAIAHAKEELRPYLAVADAAALPFDDGRFDLVISLTTIHNLILPDAVAAFAEIERVGRRNKYVVVESYRTEEEKVNLLYWQLTCECFFRPEEWTWVRDQAGYTGDHSFIYFE
jgi:protein-L-isoaspartate(D-aspartate) O-methyltransferase